MIKELQKTIKVKATFTVEPLGSASSNMETHERFIASKSKDELKMEEELMAVQRAITAKTKEEASDNDEHVELTLPPVTLFPRDEKDNLLVFDYQLKGMFKEACGALRRVKGSESKKLTAYKSVIDLLVFVTPRQIPLLIPEGKKTRACSRSLRTQGPKGPRVSIGVSEAAPSGTQIEFTVRYMELDAGKKSLNARLEDCIYEWLDYAQMHGLGQWRNGGKGSFDCILDPPKPSEKRVAK